MPLTEQEEFELLSLEREKSMSQGQQQSSIATPDQYLSSQERITGGFRNPKELEMRREQQRAERGLVSGTPLEPTGFNLENFMDLPMDIAELAGPAFPAIGQVIGNAIGALASTPTGGSAAPLAIAVGGVTGAGLGESMRQYIGENILKFDQGPVGERAFRVGAEAAFGAAGEGLALGINSVIRATKYGIIKGLDKVIEKKGQEGIFRIYSKIVHNLKGNKIDYAIDSVRRGDMSVLSKELADPDFAMKFSERLFVGKDNNLIRQIYTLSHRPGAKEPIKELYKTFFNLSDETLDTIFKNGISLEKFNNETTVLSLAKQIESQLGKLFETTGSQLKVARQELAKSAKNVDIGDFLTQANQSLAEELTNVGFLIREGTDSFSINPKFAATPTGRSQAKMFGQMVSKFFKTEKDDILVKQANAGDVNAIIKLANRSGERRVLFTPANPMKFGDFIDTLKNIDVQISGSEFESVGKLSPQLTTYLRSIRGITNAVDSQYGNGVVTTLNEAFRQLAENAEPLRQGTKIKDLAQIESALKKFANVKSGDAVKETGQQLNDFLQKNIGLNFIDELKKYKAVKEVNEVMRTSKFATSKEKMKYMMKSALGDETNALFQGIERDIDPFLPKELKISLAAKRHVVAEALHKDATGLLKARFISGALGIPTAIAGATGGILGGKEGAMIGGTAGLATGIALQNPAYLRALLYQLSKKGLQQAPKIVTPQLPRGSGAILTQLIRMGQNKNE